MRQGIAQIGAIALALIVWAVSAAAQTQTRLDCASLGSGSEDRVIRACGDLIQRNRKLAAWAHYHRGRAHDHKKDYDLAIADYSEALRINGSAEAIKDPDGMAPITAAEIHNKRAHMYLGKRAFDQAIADYSEAIRRAPAADRVGSGAFPPLFLVYYRNRGHAYAAKGDFDRAIADYTESGAVLDRGYAHYQKGDHERAIADFSEAIRRSPKRAETHHGRGVVYAARKDYDRAMADFNEAIRLLSAEAAVNLLLPSSLYFADRGMVYRLKGDFERAIADYNEAVKRNPKDGAIVNGRGVAHHEKGDFERAIADYSEALRLLPGNAMILANRGRLLLAQGSFERAIADLDQSIKLDPKDGWAYADRGFAYGDKGDYDRAIADFNEAIRLSPSLFYAYAGRGQTYGRKGDAGRAIVDLNEAIRLDASYLTSYVFRGQLYEAKGERGKAIDDYTKALALTAKNKSQSDRQAVARQRLAALSATATAASQAAPAATVPPTTSAAAPPVGRRVALAIGNGTYRKVDPLPNPRKDAADIAAALKATGFADVTVLHDLGLKELQRALAAFQEKAAGADWAVVYYGGHAIQVDGKNFLVPVDAELKSSSDVEDETVVLDRVLARIAAAGKLRLVILDACRTNPFRRLWATAKPAAGSQVVARDIAERGLRRYDTTQRNLLIAYAAAEGQVALDGPSGGNSPYVKALLKHLATPGLEINKLFRLVGDDVMAETAGKQQPFEYGSRSGEDLFFRAASR